MRHHLVILHRQYLDLLLGGRKRVECRLSSVRRAPYEAVAPGDLLWLKPPSQAVCAVVTAGECEFRELTTPDDLARVQREHGRVICAAPGFFEEAACWARFCSLIWIKTVVSIQPMPVWKSDQRAWVVLREAPRPGMRV